MLESCWCICQANGDNYKLMQTLRYQKGSFMLVAFAYADLMVSMTKASQAKHGCFAKVVNQIGNLGNWEYIQLYLMI